VASAQVLGRRSVASALASALAQVWRRRRRGVGVGVESVSALESVCRRPALESVSALALASMNWVFEFDETSVDARCNRHNEAAARIASGNLCSLDIIGYSSRTFYRGQTRFDGHLIWSIIIAIGLGKADAASCEWSAGCAWIRDYNAAILNLRVEKIMSELKKMQLGSLRIID